MHSLCTSAATTAPCCPSSGPKVVGVGGAVVDFLAQVASFPHPDDKIRTEKLEVQGGGNCGNALTAAARLGARPLIVTKIGADSVGDTILSEFHREGIDTQCVLRAKDAPSPFTYIIVDRQGATRTCIHTPGEAFTVEEVTPQLINTALQDASIVYFDGRITEVALLFARAARARGVPIIVEAERLRPLLVELMQEADYLVCSARFPENFTGELCLGDALLATFARFPRARWMVTTLGKRGSVLLERVEAGGEKTEERREADGEDGHRVGKADERGETPKEEKRQLSSCSSSSFSSSSSSSSSTTASLSPSPSSHTTPATPHQSAVLDDLIGQLFEQAQQTNQGTSAIACTSHNGVKIFAGAVVSCLEPTQLLLKRGGLEVDAARVTRNAARAAEAEALANADVANASKYSASFPSSSSSCSSSASIAHCSCSLSAPSSCLSSCYSSSCSSSCCASTSNSSSTYASSSLSSSSAASASASASSSSASSHLKPPMVRVTVSQAARLPAESVIDTTGAGDAFIGSLCYSVARGLPVSRALTLASVVAACKCSALGARKALPHREQIAADLL